MVISALPVAVVATGFAVSHGTTIPPRALRIAQLRAAVVEMGKLSSFDFYADQAYGVRLQASVCFGRDAMAVQAYPLEFQVTHFAFSDSQSDSWGLPFRTVADNEHWLVPFGESGFDDNGCSEVVVEDVMPDSGYRGLESELGVLSAPPVYAKGHCYGLR